jgi:hypothetical protein
MDAQYAGMRENDDKRKATKKNDRILLSFCLLVCISQLHPLSDQRRVLW